MTSQRITPSCLLIACIALSLSGSVQSKTCSPALAEKADAAIDSIENWEKLFSFYERFSSCDDGSISEGISESIARLLVDQPNTLVSASDALLKHSTFRRFTLRHIDSTLNTDDLTKIANLPASACPTQLTSFCEAIRAAARKTLKSDN